MRTATSQGTKVDASRRAGYWQGPGAGILEAKQHKADLGMTLQRLGNAGDDHFGAMVPTHQVDRNPDHAPSLISGTSGQIGGQKILFFPPHTTDL
jgi:hypothetical protein